MALERVLEPEVMDTQEEAVDYNAMDHEDDSRSIHKAYVRKARRRLFETVELVLSSALIDTLLTFMLPLGAPGAEAEVVRRAASTSIPPLAGAGAGPTVAASAERRAGPLCKSPLCGSPECGGTSVEESAATVSGAAPAAGASQSRRRRETGGSR